MIKSRRMRWTYHVAHKGETRNACWGLVGKPEGRKHYNNIRMDLREIGWDGMDWIHLDEDRDQWRTLVSTTLKFRVL
jgi:hypothetical protein